LRVAHLTSDHAALDSRIFYKECRSLARAGYQVFLLGPHAKDAEIDGVRIKAIRPPRTRWSRLSITLGQLWREAVRVDAEVYHLHDPELLPLGLWLRRRGKAVIYDVHDDFPALASIAHYLPFPGPLRRVPPYFLYRLEKFASPRMSAIVAADETLGVRFAALNENCVIVHNLPQPEELAPPVPLGWELRSNAVAYVGTFALWRGLREMVLAMDHLPKSLDCTLFLVGPLSPQLREEIARLPGRERVQITGTLDRIGVREILSTVRAGLVILHPSPRVIRTWPIKIFEYMAAGIPVIASDFPLWRQLLGHPPSGLFVDPLDPKSIARAIEYVLTDSRAAEQMGQRGRRAVEEVYNWSTEERALLHLYQRIQEAD
jgi:glycosyltransferase involved in cell wall biosynthesis